MLAAQCNKLSNKSPPPLADAAVGKGFHPWKKSPSSGPQSPIEITSQNNNHNGSNSSSNNNNLINTTQRSISGSPMHSAVAIPSR